MNVGRATPLIPLTLVLTFAPPALAQSMTQALGGKGREASTTSADGDDAQAAPEDDAQAKPKMKDLIRHIRVHWSDEVKFAPQVNEARIRAGGQAWTAHPEQYEGPIVFFRTRGQATEDHFFNADQNGWVYYAGSWDADLKLTQNGVEGYDVYVRLLTIEERRAIFARKGFHLVKHGVDFGEINVARDEGIDLRNYQDAAVRWYGTWGVTPNMDTGFFVDLSASVGVAHAASMAERADITNAFGGYTTELRFEHRRDKVSLFFENRKGLTTPDGFATRKAKFALGWEHEAAPESRLGTAVRGLLGDDARLSWGLEGGKRSFRWNTTNEFNSMGPVNDTYEKERFRGFTVRVRFR